MYFTDDSLLPEYQPPLMITAAPYGPGSSLGNGKLDGRIVTCRSHGMKIDVVTGCFPASEGFAVASYPVIVVAGMIMVSLDVQRSATFGED